MKKKIEICTIKKEKLINLFDFCSGFFSSKFFLDFKIATKDIIEITEKVAIKYQIQNTDILKYFKKMTPPDNPKEGKKSGVIT